MAEPPLNLVKSELTYTSCYCEENIYCLIRDHVPSTSRQFYSAVFISNAQKQTPLFYQGPSPSTLPVTWDYHVILIHHPPLSTAYVYDFDSALPFPTPFTKYYGLTLNGDKVWADPGVDQVALREYLDRRRRRFRVVAAGEYLRCFASSREHMKLAGSEGVGVKWMAEPPGYPAIRCELGEDTLGSFLDFGKGEGKGFGKVVDERGFWEEFAGES